MQESFAATFSSTAFSRQAAFHHRLKNIISPFTKNIARVQQIKCRSGQPNDSGRLSTTLNLEKSQQAMPSPQSLRILHTESSPSLGGQELRILLEIEEMEALGFASALIARRDSQILAEARKRGLDAHPIDIRSSVDPLAIGRFLRFLKQRRIDLVNAHNSKDGWNVALAAKLLGIPVVRSRHIANPIRSGKLSQLIYGPLCDVVMTTSESIRQDMMAKGVDGSKIVSIPTGVDITRFSSGTRGRFRASLGIPATAQLVGQIAVLRGSKGPHTFLAAAQQLVAEGCPAWFVLVGEGPSRKVLEKMLAENPSPRIVLTGHRDDIPDVLADLDLAVLAASQPEGVPQAVLQAFAARVPVIASDLGGINEVAINGQTAVTLPANAPEVLAQAIAAMLATPGMAEENVVRARALAETRYSREVMLQSVGELYSGLIARKRARA
jgi:glycosyltransferase involved in cell wall biosynthesis